jgi:hypothetical protein
MPAPLLGAAAAAAARLVAKKVAQRAAGGITGAASKSINPVYKEVGPSVKVIPGKTAPKTGLENRGNKVTSEAAKKRAQDLKFDMQEKAHEAQIERMATGMKGPKMGPPSTGGKANIKKFNAISKQASSKPPVKIKSK